VELLHSGKVREVYADRGDIILVASDRVSVYDVVLPTPIPDKGALLTQLSLWWFGQTADVAANHVISGTDVPDGVAGRALRCRALTMLPVECIARGYLSGSGLKEYQRLGSVCGIPLPPGLEEGSQLPEPIFTPSSKAPQGEHDEAITFDDVVSLVGADVAARLRDGTLALYQRGAALAASKGILMADTKFEFGTTPDGELLLGDEIFTSDSSRYWPADEWEPGRDQRSFDKQIVRNWASGTGWDKTAPGPEVPDQIVSLTRDRYVELYERLTGQSWLPPAGS
jgi:phosphoribosylaminoimidazole-succinocarboxamide synthase